MDATLRVQRILWGALVMSTFMYLGVLQVVVRPTTAPDPMLFWALAAAAMGSAAASVMVPDLVGRNALHRAVDGLLRTRGDFHPDAMPSPRDAGLTAEVIDNGDQVLRAAAPVLQTRFIMGMALSESVALMGFIAAFLGFPLMQALGYFGVAWALMAWRFPREEAMRAWVESALGVRFS